jgi:hypothetical protein
MFRVGRVSYLCLCSIVLVSLHKPAVPKISQYIDDCSAAFIDSPLRKLLVLVVLISRPSDLDYDAFSATPLRRVSF